MGNDFLVYVIPLLSYQDDGILPLTVMVYFLVIYR